jgi:hypothetical protein
MTGYETWVGDLANNVRLHTTDISNEPLRYFESTPDLIGYR